MTYTLVLCFTDKVSQPCSCVPPPTLLDALNTNWCQFDILINTISTEKRLFQFVQQQLALKTKSHAKNQPTIW